MSCHQIAEAAFLSVCCTDDLEGFFCTVDGTLVWMQEQSQPLAWRPDLRQRSLRFDIQDGMKAWQSFEKALESGDDFRLGVTKILESFS